MWEWLYHPSLENVLDAIKEFPESVMKLDGRLYIDIELVVSLIDHTIHTNIEKNPEHETEVTSHMATLAGCTRFLLDLMSYKKFQDQLASIE